jgi:hypothetical protein
MNKPLVLMTWAAAVGAVACVPVIQRSPVEVVRTRTPGVTYVVVHPAFDKTKVTSQRTDGTGQLVAGTADYVLMCDGRPATGMVCAPPGEVAVYRASLGPDGTPPTDAVAEQIGVLADVSIESSEKAEKGAAAAPEPEPEPPAPPPPAAPPAPPAEAEEGGEK